MINDLMLSELDLKQIYSLKDLKDFSSSYGARLLIKNNRNIDRYRIIATYENIDLIRFDGTLERFEKGNIIIAQTIDE